MNVEDMLIRVIDSGAIVVLVWVLFKKIDELKGEIKSLNECMKELIYRALNK